MIDALFGLKSRIALVTGSSQGIGLALAEGLGKAGATVAVNGRDAEKVERAVAGLKAQGIDARPAAFDVTDAKAVAAGVARIEAEIGPIDILINNAGIQRRNALEDYDPAVWREIFAANVDSVFYVAQAVARGMIARKRGKIVNIGSVQSELGRPSIAPYAATKGAVKMLTKGMCADWAKHGIQVNALSPGYFATELNKALVENPEFTAWLEQRTPQGRWGKVEELVGCAIFLSSEASNFVNGQNILVDGGMTATV